MTDKQFDRVAMAVLLTYFLLIGFCTVKCAAQVDKVLLPMTIQKSEIQIGN